MGEQVFEDPFVSINGVDLSEYVRSVRLNPSADIPEITAGGDTSRTRLVGLLDWDFSVDFNQDFDAAKVDDTLSAVHFGRASVPVIIRPKVAAVSATNPQWSGNAVLSNYSPIDSSVGDVMTTNPSFSGDGDLTRATA